ncbi:MAG: hypothetical protein ACWGOV_01965 [Acidiferrobacterales bacterium]
MNSSKPVVRSVLLLISMISWPGAVIAELPKRVFDVHLHFSYDQAGVTTPQESIDILKKQNVVYGVVSSTPPEMALDLKAADPHRILALWRPYFDANSRHNWFNDARALTEARKALSSGKYIGIGELHMISGLGATPKNTILNSLVRLGMEYNVPLLIHTETSSYKFFLPLCKSYPRARFLWAHAGGRLGPDDVGALMRQCKNVWVEFAARDHWRYIQDPIVDENGRLLKGWLELIRRYPDRFMIGADPVWPVDNLHSWDQPDTGWHKYNDYLDFHRKWLAYIPNTLADQIRYDNAYKFFFGKSERIRKH